MTAFETFPEPKVVTVVAATPNKKEIGKAFKRDAKVNSLFCSHHTGHTSKYQAECGCGELTTEVTFRALIDVEGEHKLWLKK